MICMCLHVYNINKLYNVLLHYILNCHIPIPILQIELTCDMVCGVMYKRCC